MKQKICLAGKSNSLVHCIQHLMGLFDKDSICVIPARSDNGKDDWQYSITKYCEENNINICSLDEVYDIENLVFISIQFDIILKPDKFKSKSIYNIHFSLLPDYKGVYPAIWPILNGEKESGVTLHIIDAGIDTGDIIDQEIVPINIEDTSRDLYLNCQDAAVRVFRRNVINLVEGNIKTVPQPSINSRYFSKNSINFSNSNIDFNATAYQIHNNIRAFVFREFQLPVVLEKNIYKSEILSIKRVGKPGSVMEENEQYMVFSTIDYAIKLYIDYADEFFKCCIHNDTEILKKIIPFITDLNMTNKNGWSGTMMAAFHEHLDIIKLLIEAGVDVNTKNYKGTTILMYAKSAAAKSNRLDVMDYLIGKGALLNVKDDKNVSLLQYAQREGNGIIVNYLKEKGAVL